MLISQVKKLSPLERCLYFIRERESIRLKKDAGEPKPWSQNTILQNYRFCNIRRMDDKVSKWLYNNWYQPNFDHIRIIWACGLARFINKPDSLAEIYGIVFEMESRQATLEREIKAKLRQYRDKGNTVFNGAYMVRGNDGEDKISSVVDYYCKPLFDLAIDSTSMEETHLLLQTCYGMGSFMAGQVVADLRWAMEGKWQDRNSWAPIGPGSKRGMNRLLGLDIKSAMNQQEFNVQLLQFIEQCNGCLPSSITDRMEAIDYQNCLCEFDKMERTLFDNRHPKQKYPGVA